jgi:hypothetical protein
VVGDQIHYSDAKASGSMIWKRNGRQIDKQQLKGTIGADAFSCTGDKLVQYGDGYTVERVQSGRLKPWLAVSR